MNLIQGFIYGIVSGLSHFLPVPALTNQSVLLKLFGVVHKDHLCDMIVHICILAALIVATGRVGESTRRISGHARNSHAILEKRFIKHTSYSTCIFLILYVLWTRMELNYLLVFVLLIINGVIIFAPSRMYQGNKDARSMSFLDSVLFGAANALTAVPGFSGAGCCLSVAAMRGADRSRAANWLLSISIPALIVLTGADIVLMISNFSSITFGNFFTYFFAGIAAFVGGYCSILLLKFLVKQVSSHEFAFYSWGLSLLMLLLFLI